LFDVDQHEQTNLKQGKYLHALHRADYSLILWKETGQSWHSINHLLQWRSDDV